MKDLNLITDLFLKKKELQHAKTTAISKLYQSELEKIKLQYKMDDSPSYCIADKYERECVRSSRLRLRIKDIECKLNNLFEQEDEILHSSLTKCDVCGSLTDNTPIGSMELVVCKNCIKYIERAVL